MQFSFLIIGWPTIILKKIMTEMNITPGAQLFRNRRNIRNVIVVCDVSKRLVFIPFLGLDHFALTPLKVVICTKTSMI